MKDEEGDRRSWEAPRWLRRVFLALLVILVMGALFLAFRPQPVSVDLAAVTRGTIEVAVEEDGRTRVRDRYEVTAPVSGTLRRVQLRPGDPVDEGADVVHIEGPASPLTDPRTDAQLQARIQGAEAGVERARALTEAAEAGLVEARESVRRQEILLETGGGSDAALERARALLRAREAEARSAAYAVRAAEREVEELRLARERDTPGPGGSLILRAPVSGVVLRVHRESGGAVAPGEPLLEIGDPEALEAVVDLLSADAVRVPLGAEATLSGWGGGETLDARVRLVEPAGFTRISALGIEEQRVRVLLDPLRPEAWRQLGDGFRVEARIVVERAGAVLRVPVGALSRSGEDWIAFRAEGDRLREVPVQIGRRSSTEAEVLGGLEEGDRVVVYPGDQVQDGVRFRRR